MPCKVLGVTLRKAGIARVVVVNGDTPLITPGHVSSFVAQGGGADVAFMDAHPA